MFLGAFARLSICVSDNSKRNEQNFYNIFFLGKAWPKEDVINFCEKSVVVWTINRDVVFVCFQQ